MDEEISTWMRLFPLLQIMHIEVVRTSLYADLARSLALHCLIGTLAVLPWHLGRGLRRPSSGALPMGWASWCRTGAPGRTVPVAVRRWGERIARELKRGVAGTSIMEEGDGGSTGSREAGQSEPARVNRHTREMIYNVASTPGWRVSS
ncbi:hypothetical protein CCMA1212_005464 [Trichoderma ghanense]|uniref:Uncharacterized protein n=1 Tax=Trichoderma ghanense TaxID=65468 RepID=A0ABY2H3H3_9HYPO